MFHPSRVQPNLTHGPTSPLASFGLPDRMRNLFKWKAEPYPTPTCFERCKHSAIQRWLVGIRGQWAGRKRRQKENKVITALRIPKKPILNKDSHSCFVERRAAELVVGIGVYRTIQDQDSLLPMYILPSGNCVI